MRPPEQAGASDVHLMAVDAEDGATGNYHDIPSCLNHRQPQPDHFPQPPLELIPHNSATQPRINGKTKPTIRQRVGKYTDHQKFVTV